MPNEKKQAVLHKYFVPEFGVTVEAENAGQAAEIAKERAAQGQVEAPEEKKAKKSK